MEKRKKILGIMLSEEKQGIYTILLIYLFAWGMMLSTSFWFRLVSWITLGLVGFTLWRIMEGLMERNDEVIGKKDKNQTSEKEVEKDARR